MYFHQFYLACLAHASYLIGSNGEAVVVDPQRDVQQYIDAAHERGLRIRYVIETHIHADFVSGHSELAERTGAEIVFGAAAGAEVPHRAVRDGDELRVGDVVLRALETPGHALESISWLVIDTASDTPHKLLTGDTLFIGDVGRPDLAGSLGYTSRRWPRCCTTRCTRSCSSSTTPSKSGRRTVPAPRADATSPPSVRRRSVRSGA